MAMTSNQRPQETIGALAMSPDEKRRPLAIMFYNAESKAVEFDRVDGVDLLEFIDIVRLYLKPDCGE